MTKPTKATKRAKTVPKSSPKNSADPAPQQLADLRQAARALEKQAAGEELTIRQRSALNRVAKLFGAGAAVDHYRAIPKKLWAKWSGKAHQQVTEQAARHNLPLDGPTINLETLAPAVHDLLGRRETAKGKERRTGKSLELLRREELLLKRMERLARQRVLLERQSVHDLFGLVADILRKVGDSLLEQFGEDAHALLDEALEEAVRLVHSLSDAPDGEH